MNKDKVQNQNILGTLVNKDESGIIAYSDQIYDKKANKSLEEENTKQNERLDNVEVKDREFQSTLENITKTGEASAASNVIYNHNDSQLDASNVQQAIDEVYSKGNTNRENDKTELEKSISDNKVAVDASIQDVYKKSNYNDGDNIIDFNTIHLITDNPEYICVAVDADEKILYGIKTDGQPYFGVGCPQQVKDYIDEQINKILGTNDITTTIDSLKEIEAFLKDFTNSDTLKALLDTKANKTDVDSSIAGISADIADKYKKSNPNDSAGNIVDTNTIFSIKDNPEYIKTLTDNVGKLIEAIGVDGIRRFFAGINIQGTLQCITDNPEYIAVWIDNQNRIVLGFKTNGDTYFGYGVPSQISSFVEALKSNTEASIGDLVINQSDISDILDRKVDKENNKSLVDNNVVKSISISDSPEYTDLKTDNEGRILSYRDNTGKLHEAVGVKTPSIDTENINAKQLNADKINYSDSNVSDLIKAIKGNGTHFDAADWSDYISNNGDNPLCLPEPYRAYINFITNDGLERLGTIDGQEAVMEFYDGYGNYFKKNVSIDQQGDSSRAQWKRNMSIDIFDNEQGGDAFAVKFGDWVAQDSYHLKAYYEDIIRGVNVINYKLCDRIARDRGILADRPYKEYINPKQNNAGSNNHDNDILNDARTISDGFPVIVYLNGDFYGVFAMQLKKHRDNFNMDRNATDNIHLDGYLAGSNLWSGKITWHSFEIRNPKPKSKKWTLLCQDGSTYNGDNAQEIMGTDSSKYDASNTSCVKSAELKANIMAVSNYMSDIKVFEDTYTASNTEENLSKVKTEIEKRFGVSQMIDLIIACNVCGDPDITKNVQWVTWGKINDTLKMFPCPWDMDMAYGVASTHGFIIGTIGVNNLGDIDNYPFKYVYKYYMTDLKARYKELRDNNIISPTVIQNMVMDWVHRIGDNNYELEYKKWNESPCHRDFGASSAWKWTDWTGIDRRPAGVTYYSEEDSYSSTATYAKDAFAKVNHVLYQSLQDNNQGHDVIETSWWEVVSWQEGKTYNKGDMVYDGVDTFHLFTAQENTTERPFKTLYKHFPKEGGNYDSALRICKWIEDKFISLDKEMEYKQ